MASSQCVPYVAGAFIVCALAAAVPAQATDSVPKLIEMLKSDDPKTRARALYAIMELGPMANMAVPALIERLEDSDGQSLVLVGKALANIGPVAVPELVRQFESTKTERVRLEIIYILAKLRHASTQARTVLFRLLDNTANETLKQKAIAALTYPPPVTKEALPKLLLILRTSKSSEKQQLAAIVALGRFGPDAAEALPAIMAVWQDPKQSASILRALAALSMASIGQKDPRVLSSLRNALSDEHADTRLHSYAVDALRTMGTDAKAALGDVIGTMKKLQWSDDASVNRLREACLVALSALDCNNESAFEAVLELAAVPGNLTELPKLAIKLTAIREILKFPRLAKRAVPILIDILRTDDSFGQFQWESVMAALAQIGPEAREAIPVLRYIANSPRSAMFRTRALETLHRIEWK